MIQLVLTTLIVFIIIAVVAAVLLYTVQQKFKTEPDLLAEKIAKILPQANCGACGKAGCDDFARACSSSDKDTFSNLYCPVGGSKVMNEIAALLGFEVEQKVKQFAVIHCQGSCEKAPKKSEYGGVKSCQLQNMLAAGENGCPSGCLHSGDCVAACNFDAIRIDEKTGLPVVDIEKCVACGACVKACPRKLIELKNFDENGKLLYVACKNTQSGAQAMKNCKAACIACGKCAKLSPAMLIENNLARVVDESTAVSIGEDLVNTCPNQVIILKKEKKNNAEK